MRFRSAAILLAAAALAALGVAYYAQDVMRLYPCPLCLWERWPYRVAAALGIGAAILPRRIAPGLLWLAVPVLLAGFGIAALHVGVEHHWWPSPLPECNGILVPGDLPATPAKPCDEPVFLIPGLSISMAVMDAAYELLLAALLAAHLLRRRLR